MQRVAFIQCSLFGARSAIYRRFLRAHALVVGDGRVERLARVEHRLVEPVVVLADGVLFALALGELGVGLRRRSQTKQKNRDIKCGNEDI